MTTLLIRDFTNSSRAISASDGEKVYREILSHFERKDPVILDFSGIELTITAFLNSCIGKLYNKFSSEQLRGLLEIKNLNSDDIRLLKIVVDKAKDRFNNPNLKDDNSDIL